MKGIIMETKTVLQTTLEKIDADVEKIGLDFKAKKEQLENQILQAEQERDKQITDLRAKRDEIVLKEKLKEYPAELVNNHKTCSICGGLMRPFKYMEGEKVAKAWACQAGGLSESHDLIRVP